MGIQRYVKAPVERKRYLIRYVEWLDTGELVSSVVFTPAPVSAQNDPLVIDGIGITPEATAVQYYASGGVVGVTYRVLVVMTTAGGQVREDVVLFSIREP